MVYASVLVTGWVKIVMYTSAPVTQLVGSAPGQIPTAVRYALKMRTISTDTAFVSKDMGELVVTTGKLSALCVALSVTDLTSKNVFVV